MEHPCHRHRYITTASGRRIHSRSIVTSDVHLPDIAHSLAMQCRYLGHTSQFYSVAEHSVLVSQLAEQAGDPFVVQRCALLHDAHEAYCGDFPSPYKLDVPEHAAWEDEIEHRVRTALGLPTDPETWERVKLFDTQALHVESACLLPDSVEWVDHALAGRLNIYGAQLWCHDWRMAKRFFIKRAEQLGIEGFRG